MSDLFANFDDPHEICGIPFDSFDAHVVVHASLHKRRLTKLLLIIRDVLGVEPLQMFQVNRFHGL